MPRKGQRPELFRCAAKGSQQCTAHSKRSGSRCRSYAVVGRTTCRMHGGTSKRSHEHWNYRSGRYSKDMEGVVEKIHQAMQRPIRTIIAVYPDSIAAGGKVFPAGRPRHVAKVSFPDEMFALSVLEEMHALREASKQVNAELRILRAAKKHVHARLNELSEIVERECERYEQSQAEGASTAKPNGTSRNGTSKRSEK